MITTSEIIAVATIWLLTAIGGFFSLRAAWRRRKERRSARKADGGEPGQR